MLKKISKAFLEARVAGIQIAAEQIPSIFIFIQMC